MLKLIFRLVLLIAGSVLLLDAVLPVRTEVLRVDQHTSGVVLRTSATPSRRWQDTQYTLHLVGGVVSSCSVGYSAYTGFEDGDVVTVESTKLFRDCVSITKGANPLETGRHWRLWVVCVGCILIAAGVGWIGLGGDRGLQID